MFFHFSEKEFSEFFLQFSESSDSKCKMSWNGRCHRGRLARKWSWIWSDGSKVPQMQRKEKTILNQK